MTRTCTRNVECLYRFAIECNPAMIHHRDTEDAEEAQRIKPLCDLCVLCVSVVSLILATLKCKLV